MTPYLLHETAYLLNLVLRCRWSLPGVWGFAAYITATNYLQAQKIVRPQVVTSSIVLALHIPINLFLIYACGKQTYACLLVSTC